MDLDQLAALVTIILGGATIWAWVWGPIRRALDAQQAINEKTQKAIEDLNAHLDWLEDVVERNYRYSREMNEASLKVEDGLLNTLLNLHKAAESGHLAGIIDSQNLQEVVQKVTDLEQRLAEAPKTPPKRGKQST
jgi:hypothetical protein